MNLLSKLKPAETLILIETTDAELKNLMKFTFMDLVLKQVLIVQESVQTYKRGNRYREQRTKYVIKGKNFDKYQPNPYELIYLSTFHKSPEIKAILTKLIQVAYEAVRSEKQFRKSIINSSPIKGHFTVSFFQQLFGTFSLSAEGISAKQMVKAELNKLDSQIGDILKNNPKEALEILIQIGGNIFLLKNLDFDLLRKIDKSIISSMNIQSRYDSYDDFSWWYYMDFSNDLWLDSTFDSWDDTFDSFDSSYDDASCSSFDSGCSSCSGCSGCGGCGGCD